MDEALEIIERRDSRGGPYTSRSGFTLWVGPYSSWSGLTPWVGLTRHRD